MSTLTAFLRWVSRSFLPNALFTLFVVYLVLTYQHVTAQTGEEDSTSRLPFVTSTFAYQGFLTTAAGQPIQGNRALTFRLYANASGGPALWTEVRNIVAIENGLFEVRLGAIVPIPASLWDNSTLYLGVQVEAAPELSPREPIGLVPVAQRALTADLALSVPDGSMTSEKLNPTLEFVPAPDDIIILSGANTPILTTTITVDVPSRVLLIPNFDFDVTQGPVHGMIFVDGVQMESHVALQAIESGRASLSIPFVIDLATGSHDIVLAANVSAGQGQIRGYNSGITYLVVSQ